MAPDPGSVVEPEPPEKPTRPYIIEWRGQVFAVEGTRQENVRAHLAACIRREAKVRLATFEDGVDCATKGIALEIAGGGDMFDGGES